MMRRLFTVFAVLMGLGSGVLAQQANQQSPQQISGSQAALVAIDIISGMSKVMDEQSKQISGLQKQILDLQKQITDLKAHETPKQP
jgi:TolA-binding protein